MSQFISAHDRARAELFDRLLQLDRTEMNRDCRDLYFCGGWRIALGDERQYRDGPVDSDSRRPISRHSERQLETRIHATRSLWLGVRRNATEKWNPDPGQGETPLSSGTLGKGRHNLTH